MDPSGTFQPYSNFSNHKAALIFPSAVCLGKYPPRVWANRDPQAPQTLSLRAGISLHSLLPWLVGRLLHKRAAQKEPSLSPSFLLPPFLILPLSFSLFAVLEMRPRALGMFILSSVNWLIIALIIDKLFLLITKQNKTTENDTWVYLYSVLSYQITFFTSSIVLTTAVL